MTALPFSPRALARALGGDAHGNRVLAPGPGHSRKDRSLSILVDPRAPGGFLVHSQAGDPDLVCKDYVRERAGLETFSPNGLARRRDTARRREVSPAGDCCRIDPKDDDAERTARALALWAESRPPAGTPVQAYLERRGLALPDGAGEAIRYHAHCPFAGKRTPVMMALVTDIITNKPKAVHRTAISLDGHKVRVADKDRLALGPIGGGAIKISADTDVTLALGIGEGIESTLSLRELPEFQHSPVWSVISAGGIATFPVVAGLECLWIAVDHDLSGAGDRAALACADRWRAAGREVFLVKPKAERADLNDTVKGRRRHGSR